jgi:spore protease
MNVDYEQAEEAPNDMKKHLMGQIGLLSEQQIKTLIEDVLTPNGFNMMVTPKEIDADIEDLAKIIAMGIDITLHKSIRDNYLKE